MRERVVFFCHHKCGSGWITDVAREVAIRCNRVFEVFNTIQAVRNDPLRFARAEVVVLANSTPAAQIELDFGRAVHVVRDPREVLVSAYYSHRTTHGLNESEWPELGVMRETLQRLERDDGLAAQLTWLDDQLTAMTEWDYSRSDTLELKFEDLTRDPLHQFRHAFGHLGLVCEPGSVGSSAVAWFNRRTSHVIPRRPFFTGWLVPRRPGISATELTGIVWERRFERMAGGRSRGEVDSASHYRSGVADSWRRELSPERLAELDELHPTLLARLEYR